MVTKQSARAATDLKMMYPETISVLHIPDAFRRQLKPCFGFSQARGAYYFTDSLLSSSLAKSKPDTTKY
jgi:hypothetical protein